MEPRSDEREKETPATVGTPSPAASFVRQTGILMAFFTLLGILLTVLGVGLQGASLSEYRRQADALESIAESIRARPVPTSTPGITWNAWEDSSGNDRCSIVEDGESFRVEGEDRAPCIEFLSAHPWFPDLDGPNL